MGTPLLFLGGALSGMAALIGTAFVTMKSDPKLKSLEYDEKEIPTMPAEKLIRILSDYSCKMALLDIQCMRLDTTNFLDSFRDSPLFQLLHKKKQTGRINIFLKNTQDRIDRYSKLSQLDSLRNSAAELFGKYRAVLVRGNEILKEQGMHGYSINSSILSEAFSLDSALPIKQWTEGFQDIVSRLGGFFRRNSFVITCMMNDLIKIQNQQPDCAQESTT